MKKALILDLDNTIYPVSSIAENLFDKLFKVLDQHAESINMGDSDRVAKIKDEMTRRPFQHIADEYNLDKALRDTTVNTLKKMTYDLPMFPFEDYAHIRQIPLDKFLVTTGFEKLQMSKVKSLGIEQDFKSIHIVDPEVSNQTKKDVFEEIMQKHNYAPNDLLVIGDDPESEIKAAKLLGIDTLLYDPNYKYPNIVVTHRADNFKSVFELIK